MNFRRTPSASVAHAWEKLLEVDYFGVLIRYVTTIHAGLLPLRGLDEVDLFPGGSRPHRNRPVEEELSYLLSAYLNAAYSTIEYLKREPLFRDHCAAFLAQHRAIYGSGPTGGLRTRTVHFNHVKPEFKGRLTEQTRDGVHRLQKMLRRMKVPITYVPQSEDDTPAPLQYYIDATEPQDDVAWLSSRHFFELQKLVKECEALCPPDADKSAAT